MSYAAHMSNVSEREYKKQKPSKGSRLQCRRQQRQRQQQQQCLLMLGALSLTLSHLLTRACSRAPLCVWVCCCSVEMCRLHVYQHVAAFYAFGACFQTKFLGF